MDEGSLRRLNELAQRRIALIDDVWSSGSGQMWCEANTRIADSIARLVFDAAKSSIGEELPVSVVATGGYGRMELSPWSDIDLTVVPLDESHPELDRFLRVLFRELHSAFGGVLRLEVGYGYRLIADAPVLDSKTRTGLMDARLVAGSSVPFDHLMSLYWDTFPVGEFLIEKLRERDAAFVKHHETPLVVEPNLKEGAGGLRCFQAANWLRAAIGERPRRATPAYDAVLRMRNLLHAAVGRKWDVLSRQRQEEIGGRLGVNPLAMMSDLAGALCQNAREYSEALEALHETRYPLTEGVMAIRGEARIVPSATLSRAAAGVAIATMLGLDVAEIEATPSPEVNGPEALFALQSGEATLRNMDRCGVLERLLPDLAAVRTLMPTDPTHQFTVFEHTLRVVRRLDSLKPGDFLGDLKAGLSDEGPLYLAALLHDVGKLESEPEHSRLGEIVVRSVGQSWGLNAGLIDAAAFLVREHLTMALFFRMRDVRHPATAQEFAALVGEPSRLDMLTLLTWADIGAVSDSAWTDAQMSFLRELHERTVRVLEGGQAAEADAVSVKRRMMRDLKREEVPETEVQSFLDSLPAHYLVSTPPDLVRIHMSYVKSATDGQPVIDLTHVPSQHSSDLTIACPDAPGLLSQILGTLYAFDLSVHGLRASTTRSDKPIALDVFSVSFGDRPIPPATAQQLTRSLKDVIEQRLDVVDLLRQRGKDPERPQRLYSFHYIEGSPGILEISAPRGRGMAYRFSRLISRNGWSIVSARVGQWGGRGSAAFYVLDREHRPIPLLTIQAALSGQV